MKPLLGNFLAVILSFGLMSGQSLAGPSLDLQTEGFKAAATTGLVDPHRGSGMGQISNTPSQSSSSTASQSKTTDQSETTTQSPAATTSPIPDTIVSNLPTGSAAVTTSQSAAINAETILAAQFAQQVGKQNINLATQNDQIFSNLHQNMQADLYKNGSVGMVNGHLWRQYSSVSYSASNGKVPSVNLINVSAMSSGPEYSSKSTITFNSAVPTSSLSSAIKTAFYSPGTSVPTYYATQFARTLAINGASPLSIAYTGGASVVQGGNRVTQFSAPSLSVNGSSISSSQLSYSSSFLNLTTGNAVSLTPGNLPSDTNMLFETYVYAPATGSKLTYYSYTPGNALVTAGTFYNQGGTVSSAPTGK